MACINPDGTITRPGRAILSAMLQPASLSQVADTSGVPLYRVRSVIRELLDANLAYVDKDLYTITELGKEKIE